MEQKRGKFRLRLNLFDGIVLVLALAVGGGLLWRTLKPQPAAGEPAAAASTIRYTVRFVRWPEGNEALIHEGDLLVDNVKNYELGKVVSFQTVPAESLLLDHLHHRYVLTNVENYRDIIVTVEGTGTVGEEKILLNGGYELRVGSYTYIRGVGYMASGPVTSIEREEQA